MVSLCVKCIWYMLIILHNVLLSTEMNISGVKKGLLRLQFDVHPSLAQLEVDQKTRGLRNANKRE